ncbi:MAG: nitroreductase family protein [Pontimonas sp.]
MNKNATTDYPIMAELSDRWSPRAFDASYVISDEQWGSLMEAARWAPSSSNSQPWQFVVAKRGTELFETVHAILAPGNQVWTTSVSALIVNIYATETDEGKPLRHGLYDLGQAAAHLSVQASHLGLHVHQMSGFDAEAMHQALGLEPRYVPSVMMAVGKLADPSVLPENLAEREVAPRTRKPLSEVAPGLF